MISYIFICSRVKNVQVKHNFLLFLKAILMDLLAIMPSPTLYIYKRFIFIWHKRTYDKKSIRKIEIESFGINLIFRMLPEYIQQFFFGVSSNILISFRKIYLQTEKEHISAFFLWNGLQFCNFFFSLINVLKYTCVKRVFFSLV